MNNTQARIHIGKNISIGHRVIYCRALSPFCELGQDTYNCEEKDYNDKNCEKNNTNKVIEKSKNTVLKANIPKIVKMGKVTVKKP